MTPNRRGHMASHIGRRKFLATLGGAAAAWPLAARAQQGKRIPRIGVLLFGTPNTDPNLGAFLRGLRDLGYIEAQNIVIEYRYAEGKPDRLRGLAGELVAIKPDLIFALGGDVAPSARVATNTIPIVVAVSNDPSSRPCGEPRPSRRQHHGRNFRFLRPRSQALAVPA